jgi:Trk K+ transport system NAD-binding subunit/Kef-type K+ transport system membrane component KefB
MFESYFFAATVIGFVLLAMAARQIGDYFARGKLPLISGFLAAGMLVGPYGLNYITAEAVSSLHFVDQLALAFIALAAGNELHLDELRSRLKSIAWVTIGQFVVTFSMGTVAVYLLAGMIPFMAAMSAGARLGVAFLAGSILVARSPSSAIALVKELRAKGPFTQTVLGVTVVMDVVVITLFGFASSAADTLITGVGLQLQFIALIGGELAVSVALGVGFGWALHRMLALAINTRYKEFLVVLAGLGIFAGCEFLGEYSALFLDIHVAPEPLLICVMAGFWVTNYSPQRMEFSKICHDAGPPIYVAFFMLAGASLALDVVLKVWHVGAALFGIRLVALFMGSIVGGMVAGDDRTHGRAYGLAFITQAGIGLGLAKSVAITFPDWGPEFATLIIAIIVVNQLLGPPLFKWAIHIVGESHERGEHGDHRGPRNAVIFGLEGRSVALAGQLGKHGWNVLVAERRNEPRDGVDESEIDIVHVQEYDVATLHKLGLEDADAIIVMLSDEENLRVCRLAFEHFGTPQLVARVNHHHLLDEFKELGVVVVDPAMAIVSMLDHMVRSPLAASVMLGTEAGQDIIEVEVRDPLLEGKLLRELRLPLDTLVLSVSRDGHMLVSHGYTVLHRGDHVTVIGSEESLEQVAVMFEE